MRTSLFHDRKIDGRTVESARAYSIEPHAYLSRLFAELPKAIIADHFESLLAWSIELAPTIIK